MSSVSWNMEGGWPPAHPCSPGSASLSLRNKLGHCCAKKGTNAFLWKIVGRPTLLKSALIIFHHLYIEFLATAFHSGTLLSQKQWSLFWSLTFCQQNVLGLSDDCILHSVLWCFVLGKHWNTRDSYTVMMRSTKCGLLWQVGVKVATVYFFCSCPRLRNRLQCSYFLFPWRIWQILSRVMRSWSFINLRVIWSSLSTRLWTALNVPGFPAVDGHPFPGSCLWFSFPSLKVKCSRYRPSCGPEGG